MARLPYVIPYDPDFLGDGFRVPLLQANCRGRLVDAGRAIDYIHYSLVMHQDRKMALYTVHNLDVSQKKSAPRTGWDLDPRIDRAYQTGPGAYSNNVWDRGHLVMRDAVVWGSQQEAQDASDSTFYYTNSSLQHERFNQEEWLHLENWVLEKAGDISSRLCVFTGPIYTEHDLVENDVRVPSAFWKVIVLRDPTANGGDLAALGFMMKQNELWTKWQGAETVNLRLYQVGIKDIGSYTGLSFGELANLDEFEWRQAKFRDRSMMPPVTITGPDDIQFFGDRRRARGIRALRVRKSGDGSIEAGALTTEKDKDCGCRKSASPADETVTALTAQVVALRDMVETLLENNQGNFEERALREIKTKMFRIVGGEIAGVGEFPDCACIGDGGEWFCSGVLVHKRVVLTAAHCAPQIDKVYLGGRSLNLLNSMGEVVEVERVFVHPEYDPDLAPSNDIALLLLKRDATIAPVGIATLEEVNAEDNVMLVGFGYDDPSLPIGFGTKRKVDVGLTNLTGFSENDIRNIERLHGFDSRLEFHAGKKGIGKDSCNGDSGGPAYLRSNNGFKLAGLTSRSAHSSVLPCGDGGIYTRITPYLGWIAQVTNGLINSAGGEATPGGGTEIPSEPPTTPTTSKNLPYVSAVQPNPSGPDPGKEWVEIGNPGSTPISLNQYRIEDVHGGKFQLSGVISPKKKVKKFIPKNNAVKLSNNGDSVKLFFENQLIHEVSYTKAGSGEVITFDAPQNPVGGNGGGGSNNGGGGSTNGEAGLIDAEPC